jgi:SNF2 family DNA or RNA helicase
MRVEHYVKNISIQSEVTARHKAGYEFFITSIESVSKIFENKDADDTCPICWDEHKPPIKYLKLCGHYYCSSCIEYLLTASSRIKCPTCRQETTKDDIITVHEVSEINESPKLYEIYKILAQSSERFIIFSQFDILDKFYTELLKRKINVMSYNEYSTNPANGECQVLLLSSEKNAEGINLSMFDKLIIFEPFEDHMYCKEIEKQLIARIHRIGRSKKVEVFRLITRGTIEEEIYSNS